MFDERYYKSGNYENYLFRSLRYEKLAGELGCCFDSLNISSILDFGCAVGFLVKHLYKYNCIGYDISEWAVNYGTNTLNISNLTTSIDVVDNEYDAVLFLDVLEHMELSQIHDCLDRIRTKYIFVRLPVCFEDGGGYVCDVSENDKTHIIRLSKNTWIDLFAQHNYIKEIILQFEHIWDSENALCMVFKNEM